MISRAFDFWFLLLRLRVHVMLCWLSCLPTPYYHVHFWFMSKINYYHAHFWFMSKINVQVKEDKKVGEAVDRTDPEH